MLWNMLTDSTLIYVFCSSSITILQFRWQHYQITKSVSRLLEVYNAHARSHEAAVGSHNQSELGRTRVITVADLGFPRGGCANPKGGRQPTIGLIFPENCMKMKKFWPRGARVPGAPPLDPPLNHECVGHMGAHCHWEHMGKHGICGVWVCMGHTLDQTKRGREGAG